MPRFYFHVQDGRSIPDTEGTELASLELAKFEAVRLSGQLLKDGAKEFWNGETWYMDVRDEADRRQFTLTFSARQGADSLVRA